MKSCKYVASGKCMKTCYYYDKKTGKCLAFFKRGDTK